MPSPFQTIQLQTSGPSYASRSLPISAQRSFNMYPEVPAADGIAPVVMYSWPGLSLRNTNFTSEPIYGAYVFNGEFYAVSGYELRRYSASLSSFTVVGSITKATEDSRVSITDNGLVMILAAGAEAWQWNGTTLTQIPSATFNPTRAQFLNERLYLNGDDGGISVSDVLSTNFDSGNVFYGRSTPTKTITHHIFNQIIYLFDETSIEPWSDAAEGAPPVARINNGIIQGVGCSSINGITSTDTAMYFIGSDGHAYAVKGFSAQDITNTVIANHFRGMDVSSCDVDTVSINGDKFILFHFYSDAECWVFSEKSQQWFEIGNEGEAYQLVSPVFYNNQWLCGDRQSGSIFSLATDYSLNGTSIFVKERVFATLSGEDFGVPGRSIEMSKLRLSIETGTVDPLAQTDQRPEIMLVPSFDGGYTWGRPIMLSLGRSGDYTLPVEVHMMQRFRRAVFKIRMTDRLGAFFTQGLSGLTIYSASIDARALPL